MSAQGIPPDDRHNHSRTPCGSAAPAHVRNKQRRRSPSALLTASVILAILVSSFIAAEISRSQSPQTGSPTALTPPASPASSPPATPGKIVILPPASNSRRPRKPPAYLPVPAPDPPSPPTAGEADLALHRPVTASSYTEVYYPANITDGNTRTYWESQKVFPQSITVDLGAATGISKIVLALPPFADWNSRVQTLEIYGSLASATPAFTIVPSAPYTFNAATNHDEVTINFAPVTTRYVTVYFTANAGWPAAQLAEIFIYG
jgi:F5/8 type C domain